MMPRNTGNVLGRCHVFAVKPGQAQQYQGEGVTVTPGQEPVIQNGVYPEMPADGICDVTGPMSGGPGTSSPTPKRVRTWNGARPNRTDPNEV